MKKTVVFCLVLLMFFGSCVLPAAATSAKPDDSAQAQPTVPDNQPEEASSTLGLDAGVAMLGSAQLEENLDAAFLFDASSNTLMYAWNADTQLHPASLVKILTALIAIEKGNLTDPVTVTEEVLSTIPEDAMAVDLLPGEVMSLENLLHCMMAGSANDAAAVIAAHISGSQEAFVAEMNRYAKELGCTGSVFTNPHGLHDSDQYTTARDVAKILEKATQNEAFNQFYSAIHYTVPATNLSKERYLSSSNFLMNNDTMLIYHDPRVIGGRTGTTQDGKRCVTATAEQDGMRLICVVMGAECTYDEDGYNITIYGGFDEVSALLDRAFNEFKRAQVLYANQALEQRSVIGGANDVILGPMIDYTAVIPAGAKMEDITLRYLNTNELTAPIQKGDKVSTVEVWCGGMRITVADLFALNSVQTKAQVADQTQQTNQSPVSTAVIVILSVIGGVVVLFFLIRFILRRVRVSGGKRRDKQYRRNRRRSQ